MEDRNLPCYEDEIDLIDILRVIWRWKFFIFFAVILITVAAAGFVMVKYPARTGSRAVISLSFPGIEKGKNPDGSVFDGRDIITPYVVKKAVEKMEGIDKNKILETWQDIVDVEAVIPEEMEKAWEKSGQEFFPDRFVVSVFCDTKDGKSVFSQIQAKDFLMLLINAYKDEFRENFIVKPFVFANFSVNQLNEPFDIIIFLKNKANYLLSKIDKLPDQALGYVSTESGRSIDDVKQEISQLKSFIIAQAEKEVFDQINKDEFENIDRELEEAEEKKKRVAEVVRIYLEKYGMQQPVNVIGSMAVSNNGNPGVTLDSSLIENIGKLDVRRFLLQKLLDAETAAKKIAVERQSLKKRFKETERIRAAGVQPAIMAEIKDVVPRLKALAQEANSLYARYQDKKLDGTIRVVKEEERFVTRDANLWLVVILSMVASLFFAVFLAFFIEYMKNAAKKQGNA